ncbi:FecR domain-containing protein [Sphingomonas sp. AR_OL41]|uniref:FecR family protein n=1 Tax=Sphingomonas sp. AR_OL41 TaxID=3042729 RepID=UPI002480616C|nr:FecR domain-containing protein [Sphingomonas sp. AR_OL41]MDH7972534.1 FecR domain-containing protein [Sphingomonas sp. AR_OL41]
MASSGSGGRSADDVRREASEWIARMRGPEAEMSRLDFERWRARDPRNRAAYAGMEQISRLSGRLGDTPLGRAHLAKVNRRPFFALPGPRIAFASLGVALLVGGGTLLLWRGDGPRPVAVAQASAPFETRVGQIHIVRLADGTTVTLDTDSAIEPEFTGQARVVRLSRGRARFDVAHEAGRPFMVEAGGRTIIDRGTLFDVVLGREGVKVVLLRGAVEIRDRKARVAGAAPIARLVPGQVFADAPAAGVAQVSAAPGGSDQWVKGMLSFDGAPLEDVVAAANRYSTHKIRLGEPALAGLRVTGTFRATPTDGLAAILAATFNLRVERDAHGDFILHAR